MCLDAGTSLEAGGREEGGDPLHFTTLLLYRYWLGKQLFLELSA